MANDRKADAYHFGYRWEIEGPIDVVFECVSDARTFHEWFSVFKDVKVEDQDGPIGVGSRAICKVQAILPYSLDWDITVSEYDPPHYVSTDCQLVLSDRFSLNGYVKYRFEQVGSKVVVINEQELRSERPLPGPLRAMAQKMFAYNHDWAMGKGQTGLQAYVNRRVAEGSQAGLEIPSP